MLNETNQSQNMLYDSIDIISIIGKSKETKRDQWLLRVRGEIIATGYGVSFQGAEVLKNLS